MKAVEEKVKQKIVAVISALIPETKIYLFGSRARGTHDKWSGIDLALDAGKPLPIEVVDEVKSMLGESNILYKIDVLDFHSVSESMRDSIVKERVAWKEGNISVRPECFSVRKNVSKDGECTTTKN